MCRLLLWLPKVERWPGKGGLGRVLAVEISAGPHNRLLRRQHCEAVSKVTDTASFLGYYSNVALMEGFYAAIL